MQIFKKLLELQKSVKALKKDAAAFNYNYVSGDKILSIIRPKMDDLGLLLLPEVLEIMQEPNIYKQWDKQARAIVEKKEILCTVKMRFTWVDTDSAETLAQEWQATGQNGFDKGFGSALTYGERYYLMKFLHLQTDCDDVDAVAGTRDKALQETAEAQATQATQANQAAKPARATRQKPAPVPAQKQEFQLPPMPAPFPPAPAPEPENTEALLDSMILDIRSSATIEEIHEKYKRYRAHDVKKQIYNAACQRQEEIKGTEPAQPAPAAEQPAQNEAAKIRAQQVAKFAAIIKNSRTVELVDKHFTMYQKFDDNGALTAARLERLQELTAQPKKG